jgi:hypothetical protein
MLPLIPSASLPTYTEVSAGEEGDWGDEEFEEEGEENNIPGEDLDNERGALEPRDCCGCSNE